MSDKPVIEFGNTTMVTSTGELDDMAVAMIEQEIMRHTGVLHYISDLEWIEPPAIKKAPQVDQIRRFQAYGWYARFASRGYGELKQHFACRREHIPSRVTLRWALRLWWQHRKDWR